MKTVIRRNIFETNSSSAHVLSLMVGDNTWGRFKVDEYYCGSTLRITRQLFYSNNNLVIRMEDKLSYLYALNEILDRYSSDEDFIEFVYSTGAVHPDVKIEIEEKGDDSYGGWRIDHQSYNLLSDAGVTWAEFLQEPYSILCCHDDFV